MNKLFLLLVVLFGLPLSVQAERTRLVTVSGESFTIVQPDQAEVRTMIRHVSKESAQSRQQVLSSLEAIRKSLARFGIKRDDLRQSQISQGKHNEWRNGQNINLGYYSQLTLNIEVKSLDNLSSIYDQLSNFAELQIQFTSFDHSERSRIEAEQRRLAIVNARDKAIGMLSALDEELGQVVRLLEQPANLQYREMGAIAEHARSQPAVDFGEIEIIARISVEFEIK